MTSPSSLRASTPGVAKRPRRWLVFGVAWLLLSLMAASWSFATPISASPDEPAHIVKAASVVRGQFIGEASSLGHIVQVPRYIAGTHQKTCFAFKPTTTADCAVPLSGASGDIVDSTTTAGLYNPVYYLLVGTPSVAFDTESGVYAMRVLSGIISSLFVALAFMLVYTWQRNKLPILAMAIATPPMMLFLSGSVNPNALEVAATLAVFTGMLSIALHPNPRLLTERSMIVLAGAAIAVNTRGLSPVWVAIAALAPLVLLKWPAIRALFMKRAVILTAVGTAVATAFALSWQVGSNSLTAAIGDEENFQQYPGVGGSFSSGFIYMIREIYGAAQTMIGNFGWLDTPAPLSVYYFWAAVTGALLFAALAILRRRQLVLAVVLLAAFVLVPAIIQGFYITGGGLIWQGRYSLPLFTMLIVGLFALVSSKAERLPSYILTRFTVMIWLLWAAAQFVSFATALRRYTVGSEGTWGNVISAADWNAPGGNLFWLVAFAFLVGITTLLGWLLGTDRSQAWPRFLTGKPSSLTRAAS